MQHTDEAIRQLTENVNALTGALVISERRYQNLFRWMTMLLVLFLLIVGYLSFDAMSKVQASNIGDTIRSAEEATITMGQILQQVANEMQNPEFKETITSLGQLIRNTHQLTQANEFKSVLGETKGFIPKIEQIVTNVSILTQRIKNDSDQLRTLLGSEKGSGLLTANHIQDIEAALRLLHHDLKVIPLMAEDMHQMNFKMGVMAHDVDSTMGRAGRMMPWW